MTIKKRQTKKQGAPKATGRPTRYSEALASRVVQAIYDGYSIKQLTSRKDMPAIQAFYDWQHRYEDFSKRVTRAREIAYQYRIDSCHDTIDRLEEAGELTGTNVKAIVDSRINLAKAMFPERYDKERIEHSSDKNNPLEVKLNFNPV